MRHTLEDAAPSCRADAIAMLCRRHAAATLITTTMMLPLLEYICVFACLLPLRYFAITMLRCFHYAFLHTPPPFRCCRRLCRRHAAILMPHFTLLPPLMPPRDADTRFFDAAMLLPCYADGFRAMMLLMPRHARYAALRAP